LRRRPHRRARCRGYQVDCATRLVDHSRHADETVDQTVEALQHNRNAGLIEAAGIYLSLITKGIELGCQHERARDSRQIPGPEWRTGGLTGLALVPHVLHPEPAH